MKAHTYEEDGCKIVVRETDEGQFELQIDWEGLRPARIGSHGFVVIPRGLLQKVIDLLGTVKAEVERNVPS